MIELRRDDYKEATKLALNDWTFWLVPAILEWTVLVRLHFAIHHLIVLFLLLGFDFSLQARSTKVMQAVNGLTRFGIVVIVTTQ